MEINFNMPNIHKVYRFKDAEHFLGTFYQMKRMPHRTQKTVLWWCKMRLKFPVKDLPWYGLLPKVLKLQ